MARLPVTPGGPPARRSGGIPAEQGAKTLAYVSVPRVGFEQVPEEIVGALVAEGILVGVEVAATAEPPLAKRRAEGSHYQLVTAWWASTSCYVVLDVRRELALAGEGRLRPAGTWSATGKVFHLPDSVQMATSVWRRSGGADGAGKPKSQRTDDPLDLLPPEVAKPVMGGQADAWREFGKSWATETVVASRLFADRVRVLRATRQATSRRALDGADWALETIDAPVTGSREFSVRQRGKDLSLGRKGTS
ncbi:MAG: hypothetical protein M0Z42_17250 [Actinomycetota bacterium]|nr:hypothetical protein [Actinomycetota bacterium]